MRVSFWTLLLEHLDSPTDELAPLPEPDPERALYPKKERPFRTPRPLDLPRQPTRVLLSYLHHARLWGYYSPYEGPNAPSVTLGEIKAELARRPHVPNKQEAKALRREQAMRHRGRPPKPKRLPKLCPCRWTGKPSSKRRGVGSIPTWGATSGYRKESREHFLPGLVWRPDRT